MKKRVTFWAALRKRAYLFLPILLMLLFSCCKKEKTEFPHERIETESTTAPEDVDGRSSGDGQNGELSGDGFTPSESSDTGKKTEPQITPEVTIESAGSVPVPDVIVDTSAALYTYDACCKDALWLERLFPDIIRVTYEGRSADQRPIPSILFGNPSAGKTVLIQASIHAREYMTSLLVMKLLEEYARAYDTGSYGEKTYREIFSEVNLLVVPMSNPDGVTISQIGPQAIRDEKLRELLLQIFEESGTKTEDETSSRKTFFRRFKANANGVDLNRNFAYGFQEYIGAKGPSADHYKGPSAGSEPETQLLMKLTEENPVVAALSYHATGSILYFDFGQEGAIREKCVALMENVKKQTGYSVAYAATDKQDEAGYNEWAVGCKSIPEVTVEIGRTAAPLPIEEFPAIWKENKQVPAAVAYEAGMLNR